MTTSLATTIEIGDPVAVGPLTVFPLFGEVGPAGAFTTGLEALSAGSATVSELATPTVPTVLITNFGELPLLLLEGETLVGLDQNRTLNVSVLCAAQAKTEIPVSCVEAGRWGRGQRRATTHSARMAPASLRAAKSASLAHPPAGTPDAAPRVSDQRRVWAEVDRQSARYAVFSSTRSLEDIQASAAGRTEGALEDLHPLKRQIGVLCAAGPRVTGLELFDDPSALSRYLRNIVAGHLADVWGEEAELSPSSVAQGFLAEVDNVSPDVRPGVGLGEEVHLRSDTVTGVGLYWSGRRLHLVAFPTPSVRDGVRDDGRMPGDADDGDRSSPCTDVRAPGTRYGRTAGEWSQLVEEARRFLVDTARLGRTTTYTELNAVLRQRTSVRSFDFDLDSERAAMGELLGQISEAERPASGHLLSALVVYLNDNGPGSGFFELAKQLGLLAPKATVREKEGFWVGEVAALHEHYKPRRR